MYGSAKGQGTHLPDVENGTTTLHKLRPHRERKLSIHYGKGINIEDASDEVGYI